MVNLSRNNILRLAGLRGTAFFLGGGGGRASEMNLGSLSAAWQKRTPCIMLYLRHYGSMWVPLWIGGGCVDEGGEGEGGGVFARLLN